MSDFSRCMGTLPRRSFLKLGLGGAAGLTLTDLLRAESAAGRVSSDTALIFIWLWGGASHMETFDLKPDAPQEYRGEFRPIPTSVPGLEISEHLPLLASLGERFSLIRSLSHDSPGHVSATHTLMSAYPGEVAESPPFAPKHPDLWAVAAHQLGEKRSGVPAHVALPRMRYNGGAYLGSGVQPFVVTADPNAGSFSVPNLALNDVTRDRFDQRWSLLQNFDQLRREIDGSGLMPAMDSFNQKAVSLLTGDAARRAFQIDEEDPRTRDRYGRHTFGQQALLARRLVEAGVRLVTVDFPCVPGQKAFSWDDHASVWNIFEQMKIRLPVLDQVVSALVQDIFDRGLNKQVMVIVTGEMSHTPRMSNFQGQPGREHWGQTMSVFLSGGGLEMGQVIGATNSRGDEVIRRPVSPNDLLATWYRALGIPTDLQFPDFAGRPTPIIPRGRAIDELFS